MQWLVRMARELPVAGPRDATGDVLVEWHSGHRWGRETARSVRYTVRSFYGWAHEAGHVQDNPSLALPTIRTMDQSRMPADDRDYGDALAAAGPREALILRLGAELGLRRAEIAQVHARDVQDAPDGAWLRVLGKGGKLRHLPLPDDLAEVIRERAGRGFLFRGDDRGHLSPRYVGKIASGLLPPGVTLHSLRHRFATRAYAADRDVFAVQQAPRPRSGQHHPALRQGAIQRAPSHRRGRAVGLEHPWRRGELPHEVALLRANHLANRI